MWELSTHAAADFEFNLYFRISPLQDSSMQTRGERERRRTLAASAPLTCHPSHLPPDPARVREPSVPCSAHFVKGPKTHFKLFFRF